MNILLNILMVLEYLKSLKTNKRLQYKLFSHLNNLYARKESWHDQSLIKIVQNIKL